MYEIGSCFWNGLQAIFSFLKFAVKAVAEIYDKLGDGIFFARRLLKTASFKYSVRNIVKGCF